MLKIEGSTIRLTRGDTAKISIAIDNATSGHAYVLEDGDTLTFTIKKSVYETNAIIQKVMTGSATISIEPEDTEDLSYGAYVYDVQLTTESGEIYTVVEPSEFNLTSEVTW